MQETLAGWRLPLRFTAFEGTDYSGSLSRARLEELCTEYFVLHGPREECLRGRGSEQKNVQDQVLMRRST